MTLRRIPFVWLASASIVVLLAAAYANSLAAPFVFDDLPAITINPSIRHWLTAFSPPTNGATVTGRPLLNLSFAANYAAGHLAVGGYHAVNLAIHLLATLTLFGLARRTLRSLGTAKADWAAWAIALIWGLHPLQTESVTYIVQRAESLMGLCYLLTLYCYRRGADTSGSRAAAWFAAAVAIAAIGMAVKEVIVSVPVIALLYDRTFLSGSFRAAWRQRRWALLGVGATWIPLALLVAGAHGRGGTSGFGVGGPWGYYALTQFPAITHYWVLCFWPHPLVFDYGAQWAESLSAIALPALLVLAAIASTFWAAFSPRAPGSQRRSLGFLGLWFFAILAPTSLIPGMRQTAAEHRMYLALIPVVALLVAAVFHWGRRRPWASLTLCLAAVLACAGLTFRRNHDYRTALSLWTTAVAALPENPFSHNNLGTAEQELGRLDEAIEQYREALRYKPDYSDAENNWGSVLLQQRQLEAAVAHLEAAVRMDGEYASARNNLGSALSQLGRIAEAEAQFQESLRLAPLSARINSNYGKFLLQTGRMSEAIARYETALQLEPDNPEILFGTALAYQRNGQIAEAQRDYETAVRQKPDYAEAHNNLGNLFAQSGRLSEALPQFAAAVRFAPDNAGFHANLGLARAQSGDLASAIAELRTALQLNPGLTTVERNLRLLEAQARQP